METELVVIGGGPGGYAAAFLAADLGMKVVLIEQDRQLGGTCLLRGCIPSKALLHVAKVLAEAQHLADWGVRFAKPNIDLGAIRQQKEKIISTLSGGLRQIASRRKVELIQARAGFLDPHTLYLEPVSEVKPPADRLRFEHCIIATGSRPVIPKALQLESDRLWDSTVALELPEIPEKLLVVGGGYIGLEMGTIYAALGSQVTVVEMTDGLLPGVDRDLVRPLHKRLETLFQAIHLRTQVSALADKNGHLEATFESADGQKQIQCFDRVLVAVGRRPNSENLGLEKTQVQMSQQGFIQVDSQRRTTEPSIYAIGDVAGQPMLAHKATREAKVAVQAIAGRPVDFQPRAIPAVVFTDPEIAWVGLTETEAKAQNRSVETAVFPWGASGRALSMGRTEGLTKWIIDPQTERVLGCGIVGPGAGDLIGEAALAVELACHLEDLAETIHPHPTLCETLSAAAEVFYGTATDLYKPKKRPS
ncbi:MAG: dihydrolipoyl dehydrogenase [Thermoguttaceae bacterium]|nr:dihydrolipoyl dehydrogenase [Thermoguttaceae bacterium]MDW8039172.1 dihydrolipoyl dehydrogenase [Thermoguttaceae bacterium]